MSNEGERRYTVEALDPSRHDRTGFASGVDKVDNFLQKTANKLTRADNLRVYVMTDDSRTIMGFDAINSHSVDYRDLPAKFARTRPGHGLIPAAFISMIGRDVRYRGQGFGGDLLIDCLQRIARIADQIGIAVVMLDVLDCGDEARTARRKALCASYGFMPLPSNPLRMFLPVATIRAAMDGNSP
ncbi:GNAT family N-acetyltransferase [Rhizobium alvei]|uniref:GNAT family N-acetyltransferase n=1 Tax=Rhizobium alvei TaxID=1132659 RepID=A0ABT8YGL5_9HYPH|nr:GNAT family N-acetyltransferase [Rhizobium alvei]MDO6962786.1 GNAT family N-acetyltransferase [Rhizobium alvei]